MDVEADKVAQMLAEIEGELLLKLLGSELESLKRRKPRSGENMEGVGKSMDFREEL